MLTQERKAHLLSLLAREGRLEAKSVAVELQVSHDTIRRDLRELAAEGKLQRVHGGALPKAPADADLIARQTIASSSKQLVGRTAARLIKPDQVVIVDGGTTALQLVDNFPQGQRNTVVTHSPTIAVALAPYTEVNVIMIGGTLYRHSMVNVGASAIEAMSHINADTYFMGVAGVDIAAGLTTGDLEEAHVKKALSQRAAETIVLASEEKLQVASTFVVMPVSGATGIAVAPKTSKAFQRKLGKAGLEVYV